MDGRIHATDKHVAYRDGDCWYEGDRGQGRKGGREGQDVEGTSYDENGVGDYWVGCWDCGAGDTLVDDGSSTESLRGAAVLIYLYIRPTLPTLI